ncbi:MAG TPA: hypothetical protein VN894_09400, partial [Polyangiaceae bacterium]|nr:hypothetical protein [Polyangiaceae bacterium]
MNDPKRLSEGSGSDVERTLLRAGRAGAPQGAKSRAMLVASGAMAASSLAAAGAAAEGTVAAAKVGSIVALKWIGALTVASASALTGASAMRNAHVRASRDGVAALSASTPAVAHAVDQRPISAGPAKSDLPAAPAPSIAPADPSIAPPPSPVPAAAPASVRSPPVRADLGGPPVSTLSAELAALDQARTA